MTTYDDDAELIWDGVCDLCGAAFGDCECDDDPSESVCFACGQVDCVCETGNPVA